MDPDPPPGPPAEPTPPARTWNFFCRRCGGAAEFPAADIGSNAVCPHCGAPGRVRRPDEAKAPSGRARRAPPRGKSSAPMVIGILAAVIGFVVVAAVLVLGLGFHAAGRIARERESRIAPEVRERFGIEEESADPDAPPLEFHDVNARLRHPPRPWVKFDAARVNPLAAVGFIRTRPEMYFMLAAEAPGAALCPEIGAVLELARAALKSASPDPLFHDPMPMTLGSLEGTAMLTEASIAGTPVWYFQWFHLRNGFYHQLVCWAKRSGLSEAAFRKHALRVFAGFELIEPDRVAGGAGPPLAGFFRSPFFAYAVDLAGTPWIRWEEMDEDLEEAEFGALKGDSLGVAVIPVWTPGLDPHPDALAHAMLQRFEISFPDPAVKPLGPVEAGLASGQEYAFARVLEGQEFEYRFRVLKREGFAYLLAAWRLRGANDRAAEIEAVLDRVSFEKTPAFPPDPARFGEKALHRHTLVYHDIGLYAFNAKDLPRSIEWFRAAFEFEKNDAVVLTNMADTCLDAGRAEEGLAFLDAHRGRFPGVLGLEALRASLLAAVNRIQEAVEAFGALFAGGYRDDDAFERFCWLLAGQGRTDEALAALERYMRDLDTVRLRLLQAALLDDAGRRFEGIALLRTLQARPPFSPDVAFALADYCHEEGDHKGALEQAARLLAEDYDGAYVWFIKGRAEYALKWYREAKASFEAAQERDPSLSDARDYLTLASSMLGEGSNSAVKEPIPAVEIPDELTRLPDDLAPPGPAGEYGAYYRLRITAVSYVKGRERRVTERRSVQILDTRGIEEFSSFQFPFDPLAEAIYLNRLEVKDASGKVVSTGKVDDVYVIDDRSGAASQRKVLHVPVPGLEAGRIVEIEVTTRALSPPDRMPFLDRPLFSHFPVVRAAVFVRGDLGSLRARASVRVPARELGGGRAWILERPPVFRTEPFQPSVHHFLPMVWIGDDASTWAGEARDYLAELGDLDAPTPALAAVAKEQARGLDGDGETAAALARWVRDTLTYKALAFGRSATIPRDPAATLRNRWGDCKDHALLLHLLLQAAGLKSHLALVHTAHPVVKDLPAIDQFDHMIVWAAGPGDGRFYDCTDKDADPGAGPPLALAGQEALVLDAETPRFVFVPAPDPQRCAVRSSRVVRILAAADAEVRERVDFSGPWAAYMRAYLRSVEPSRRAEGLQQAVADRAGSFRILELEVEGLESPERPLALTLRYLVPGRFHALDGSVAGRLPALWERDYAAVPERQDRWSPFKILDPLLVESETVFEAPEGFAIERFGKDVVSGGEGPQEWSVAAALQEDRLTLRFRLRRGTGLHPPGAYAAFASTAAEALDALEREVVVKRKD